ncbi:hypothetical protein [Nocardia salmonicida]|uniref:hypothetical protein n=1 Tax=Nocardia salmonicida TaxID=53431 RepID=UPI002E2C2D0C|nr:hypothetical protein [Nocardia salmonicida]
METAAALQGPVYAKLCAERVDASADNIVAWFGAPVDDPILITTPLTGWFTCAAERGPGIAIALELCAEMAARHPVLFVGTTGHEVDYVGDRAYLAGLSASLRPRMILHLGASLAAAVPGPTPNSQMLAISRTGTPSPEIFGDPRLMLALAEGRFLPTDKFNGEGPLWRDAMPNSPLLSVTGAFPQFHTPSDTADRTTDPEMLATVYTSLRDAVNAVAFR